MNDYIYSKYADVIKRATGALFQMFDGQKITHSELQKNADAILPIMLRVINAKSDPDYPSVLKAVVDLYETEVGIKTFDPNVLAKDKRSKYWLYKIKPTIPHPFFERYKLYLGKDGFQQKAIENIETTTEEILAYCANPCTPGAIDKKKGLVVGDVQSGKTANYLALINMAFDYGYKIVVLLAGTTNSLRIQTQKRTDKGVIGAKSDSIGNSVEYIGVGENTQEHYAVPFTNQKNDFVRFIHYNSNVAIGDIKKPVVLVVKKIKSVLESVSERLQSELKEKGLDSKSVLIIDDEADNASINTRNPDKEPTAINKAIRAIFNKFPIASYVGYTATPFANIFINPTDDDPDNLDLFPSDFIVQLHAPDVYFGGRKVFPKDDGPLPNCLRLISEEEPNFLPTVHDKYAEFPVLPESLVEAIHSFLINNVIRTLRGQETKHRSMMINITRFNDVQTGIWDTVSAYKEKIESVIEQLSDRSIEAFTANEEMQKMYNLYMQSEFYKNIREGSADDGIPPLDWLYIQKGLYEEIKKTVIVVINSKNGKMSQLDPSGEKKRFDYEDYEENGARVIAIGGMVLSRGLTLEGLMISYYNRNAAAYDTLLQMCRWFGYRPKYEDLCRVYLSQENIERFDAVLDAVEDLKLQFAEMERKGKIPRDFGLMIKECPDTLETTMLITSRNKMHGTETIEYYLNYGGVYADTSKMLLKASDNLHNLKACETFVRKITLQKNQNTRGYYLAQGVYKLDIADFIKSLKIPYVNKKFDTEGLQEYIENSDIFLQWDVVVATGSGKMTAGLPGIDGPAVARSFKYDDKYIRIGGSNNRVLDPGILDVGLWLSESKKELILERKGQLYPEKAPFLQLSATDYLQVRDTPILVIYPIELKNEENESKKEEIIKDIGIKTPLFAFAIAFPNKESKVKFVYRANKVKLDQLTANVEVDDDGEGEEDSDD